MVELAKIEATVSIGKTTESSEREIVLPQGQPAEAAVPVSEALSPEAQESVLLGVRGARPGDGLAAIDPDSVPNRPSGGSAGQMPGFYFGGGSSNSGED